MSDRIYIRLICAWYLCTSSQMSAPRQPKTIFVENSAIVQTRFSHNRYRSRIQLLELYTEHFVFFFFFFCSFHSSRTLALHQRRHERAIGISLGKSQLQNRQEFSASTYHGPNIRVGDGIKLLILQLVIRADVDVSTAVLGRVTVSGCRENCKELVELLGKYRFTYQ